MTDPSASFKDDQNSNKERVGFLFGLGIFLLPYIFGWFTLKNGYSSRARFFAFSWMFFVIVANLGTKNTDNNHTSSSTTAVSTHEDALRTYSSTQPRWKIGYYIDEFGRRDGKKFVSSENKISGSFSNSATTNSALNVDVLIDKSKIAILLYEYARETEVTYYGHEEIIIKVLDHVGKKHILYPAENYKGLVLVGKSRKKLIELMKAGVVAFYIENGTSSYRFDVQKMEGLDESVKNL